LLNFFRFCRSWQIFCLLLWQLLRAFFRWFLFGIYCRGDGGQSYTLSQCLLIQSFLARVFSVHHSLSYNEVWKYRQMSFLWTSSFPGPLCYCFSLDTRETNAWIGRTGLLDLVLFGTHHSEQMNCSQSEKTSLRLDFPKNLFFFP